MPPRRVPRMKSTEVEEELGQSQNSNGDDDQQELLRELAKQIRAKQLEKYEKNFLRKVANELTHELTGVTGDIRESLKEWEEFWTASIAKYGAIEAKICQNIIKLAQREDETLELFRDLNKVMDAVQHDAERASALERLRDPCQGGGTLLDNLSASADK